MLKFEFKKTINLEDEDLICILSSALSGGCNYWSEVDYLIDDYKNARNILENNGKYNDGICYEDILLQILKDCKTLKFYDLEDGETFILNSTKFFNGIQKALDENYWSGNIDDIDSVIADNIIQLGLFGEIVYS